MATAPTAPDLLRTRLLQDIRELLSKPYPNIDLQIQDDLTHACLILTPDSTAPLHLTIDFVDGYPIRPPHITIQSNISHPNVYQDYICASILNTKEGYTPAYTLKGICIHFLSFFGSDCLEQEDGYVMNLRDFARKGHVQPTLYGTYFDDNFSCIKCGFGQPPGPVLGNHGFDIPTMSERMEIDAQRGYASPDVPIPGQRIHLHDLPVDLLVCIADFM